MSTDELESAELSDDQNTDSDVAVDADQASESLTLEVKIDRPSACERHMTVTIPPEDIQRYFDDAFSEMMPKASVPGFRPGRAPRKLVEQRFRKDVADQVKGSLLMDSMAQVTEEHNLTAISEPDFDLDAVDLPDEGPMTYEFNLEVRPEFDLPQWQGLKVEKPTREIGKAEVDERLEQALAQYGQLVPFDGVAESGDYLTLNLTAEHDGNEISSAAEQVVRVREVLSFRDARLEGFGKLMKGVKADDTREAELELTQDAPNEALRGQKVTIKFTVLEVKKLEFPELNEDFFAGLGAGFSTEEEFRSAIEQDLQRQVEYHQQQRARQQITSLLTESADWELPPGLLERQSQRELERAVLELRRNGFSEEEIRARENQLRQNSSASTDRALKEHFILERIAEEQELDVEPTDYDMEIALIAAQSGQSARRVRAQLEKGGLMDSLRNQIIERKAIELVLSQAEFKEVPLEQGEKDVSAIDVAAGGEVEESTVPDAS